jgi:hypothetical protein
MPKDHLLYVALQQRGLAHATFTPTYPDADTLSLAHDPAYVRRAEPPAHSRPRL